MTSNKFIGSITNKVYNQIRKSSSDAEARRYLKEHQSKQLNLSGVVVPFVCDKHPNANTYTSTMGKVCCVKCVMG